MIITNKEFFKRCNRETIYNIYENTVARAYDASETYYNKLSYLRGLKNQYKSNTHIYEILNSVEEDITSKYEHEAYLRCQALYRDNCKVNIDTYNTLSDDIIRLQDAIGKMKQISYVVNYIDSNELGIRSV